MAEDGDMERTLGRLLEGMENLEKGLNEHRKETSASNARIEASMHDGFRTAAEARKAMYHRIEAGERKQDAFGMQVDAFGKLLEKYEPDLKRCRLFRNLIALIGVTVVGAVAFGNGILDLIHKVIGWFK